MVSLKDIALEAGVSVATVSTVLSGKSDSVGIKTLTRKKVQLIAERLGYRPNLAARGLRTKRTYTLGILLYNPRELIYSDLIAEIQALLPAQGYAGICSFWRTMEDAPDAFRVVLDRGVDGLITCHDDLTLIPKGMPAVLFQNRHPEYDSVTRNGESAMRQAVDYLLDLGHTHLGCLSLDRAKHEKTIDAVLRKRGVKTQPFWTRKEPGILADHAQCMDDILALSTAKRPTALICGNDTVAMYGMSVAGQHGIRVPQDMSFIGFDNVSMGLISNPPLTTLGVPADELARYLVDLMVHRLATPDAPRQEMLLEQRLVVRHSCAPRISKNG
jgi:DNA-binding LacI/PurR family transcriptional regulator